MIENETGNNFEGGGSILRKPRFDRCRHTSAFSQFFISYGDLRFMETHLYFTAALQRTDLRAVALQLAMDILYEKVVKVVHFSA